MKFNNEFSKDILRYGEVIVDDEIEDDDNSFIRIRVIKYDGKMYYHKMIDGCVYVVML